MSRAPGRPLRDDEHALWQDIARSIKPLRPRVPSVPADSANAGLAPKPLPKAKPLGLVSAPGKTATAPSLAPLGRRMKQRLARGTESLDGRLDLHGLTQAEAHTALLRFLRGAQNRGARNVLVITGKGARAAQGERGVLKRQVPLWLRLPEFRSLIVGFEEAHIGHGGEGALYVRVRRAY